jgi:hypothetical protein
MIYTHGLGRSTDHIMIYDGNTPIAVVKLDFNYNPDSIEVSDYDEDGWIMRVTFVLENYAKKFKVDVNNLSAKPIKVIPQWSIDR